MSIIDLHSHSTASDGKLSPYALLEHAQQRGVKVLAITDHDTTKGYHQAQDYAQDMGIILISGMEISCLHGGMNLHLLALDFNTQAPSMRQLEAAQMHARDERAQVIASRLSGALKHKVCLDEVRECVTGDVVGRPHFAQYLVAKGWIKDEKTAFDKYLGAGKIGDVKNQWVSLEQGIDAILKAEGVPVLAHAHRYKMTASKLKRCLQEFKQLGGIGLEVAYGQMDAQTQRKQVQLALQLELKGSCGSDFHAPTHYGLDIGVMPSYPLSVPPVWQQFKQALQIQNILQQNQ